MSTKKMTIENAKAALFGGKAVLTFVSVETGNRFTYKIKRLHKDKENLEEEKKSPLFVSVLSGADNNNAYRYMGTIYPDLQFKTTKASKVTPDATSFKAFSFVYRNIIRGIEDSRIEIYHSDRCCRCGKLLTVPESIDSGFGPECIKIVGKL